MNENKGLEALKELKDYAIITGRYTNHLDTIEKELKAKEESDKKLEIVKNKIIPLINFTMIKKSGEKTTYYTVGDNWNEDLYISQEEYDSLKERLL